MGEENGENVRLVQAVVQYRRMIQSYAHAIVRDFHLAEDIYQDVAVIVAKSWEKLPPDEELLPWIREITRRKSLEALRKHQRMPVTLSEETLDLIGEKMGSEPEPDGASDQSEQRHHMMEQCVRKLHGVARQVIQLRYGSEKGLSCEAIAAQMNRSVKAVYNVMLRARLALVKCLEKEEGQYAV